MGEGFSGFETPSYIFMTVFASFIALSIVIEKILEHAKHHLENTRRKGFQKAVEAIVSEVTMLGFISLILTLVEEPLAELCVDEKCYNKHWIPIRQVDECDSCFKHTRRLSSRQEWRGECAPENHHESASEESVDEALDYQVSRKLQHHEEDWNECGEGSVQFMSQKTIQEVHIAVFMIAITHTFVVLSMALIAGYRIGSWNKYNLTSAANTCSVDALSAPLTAGTNNGSTSEQVGGSASTAANPISRNQQDGGSLDHEMDNIKSELRRLDSILKENKRSEMVRSGSRNSPGSRSRRSRDERNVPAIEPIEVTESTTRRDSIWTSDNMKEWAICLYKQLHEPLTPEEFFGLKHAFTEYHGKTTFFKFNEYIFDALDDDISLVVRIPWIAWALYIVGYVFWAPLYCSAWIIFAVTAILLFSVFAVTAKLLKVVREVTAESPVKVLDRSYFWGDNPRLVLPVVRAGFFINSICFATVMYVAWQYGFGSCALASRVDTQSFVHHALGILVLVTNLLCFAHISWILLPTYTVLVHLGSDHFSQHLLGKNVALAFEKLLNQVKHKPEHSPPETKRWHKAFKKVAEQLHSSEATQEPAV